MSAWRRVFLSTALPGALRASALRSSRGTCRTAPAPQPRCASGTRTSTPCRPPPAFSSTPDSSSSSQWRSSCYSCTITTKHRCALSNPSKNTYPRQHVRLTQPLPLRACTDCHFGNRAALVFRLPPPNYKIFGMRVRLAYALFFLTVVCPRCAVAQTARRLLAPAALFRAIFFILKLFAGCVLATKSRTRRWRRPEFGDAKPADSGQAAAHRPRTGRDARHMRYMIVMQMNMILCVPGNATRSCRVSNRIYGPSVRCNVSLYLTDGICVQLPPQLPPNPKSHHGAY